MKLFNSGKKKNLEVDDVNKFLNRFNINVSSLNIASHEPLNRCFFREFRNINTSLVYSPGGILQAEIKGDYFVQPRDGHYNARKGIWEPGKTTKIPFKKLTNL